MIEQLNPQQFRAMEIDIPSLIETISGGESNSLCRFRVC